MKKMKLMKTFIALTAIVFSALSFQSCMKVTPLTQEQMDGYWVLRTLNGEDAKSQFAGALPTLQFNFEANTISGTGGCNRYSGPYTYTEGIFAAPNLAVTKMLCVENNNEGQFLLLLSEGDKVLSLENGLLTLTKDKKVIMQFEKGTAPAEKLTANADNLSGEWKLKVIDGVEAASKYTTEPGKVPTLKFDFEANRISGNSGCNNYGAPFTLNDGGQLIVKAPVSTMMACPNLEGEAQFVQAVSDTSMLTLPDANTLQFAKGDIVSLIFEKVPTEIK